MEQNNILDENYKRFKFLWDAHTDNEFKYIDIAEKYFYETLKLIIGLSTALLAFLVVLYDKVLGNVEPSRILWIVFTLILSLFFAIVSSVLLAMHYKNYADLARANRKEIFQFYNNKDYDKIDRIYKQDTKSFLSSKDAGWQWSTIIFGILSLISFFISVIQVILTLISQILIVK